MKPRKVFLISIMTGLSALPLAVPFLASCSSNSVDIKNIELKGGSKNLVGISSGQDDYCWKAMSGNDNKSKDLKWKIEPQIYGISVRYSAVQDGAVISWSNLSTSNYVFKILTTTTDWSDAENVKSTDNINLLIHDASPVRGGSTILTNRPSTSSDMYPWKIIYNDKDYSEGARWSVHFIKGAGNIFVQYNPNKQGAIVTWENLAAGEYVFTIDCIFKPDGAVESFKYSTQEIILTVAKANYLTVRGGTSMSEVICGTTGHDKKAIHCYYNGLADVIAQADLSIEFQDEKYKKEQYKSLIYFTVELGSYYITWNDTIGKTCNIDFRVKAIYRDVECLSDVIYQLRLI